MLTFLVLTLLLLPFIHGERLQADSDDTINNDEILMPRSGASNYLCKCASSNTRRHS